MPFRVGASIALLTFQILRLKIYILFCDEARFHKYDPQRARLRDDQFVLGVQLQVASPGLTTIPF